VSGAITTALIAEHAALTAARSTDTEHDRWAQLDDLLSSPHTLRTLVLQRDDLQVRLDRATRAVVWDRFGSRRCTTRLGHFIVVDVRVDTTVSDIWEMRVGGETVSTWDRRPTDAEASTALHDLTLDLETGLRGEDP
jgi:hypothetical protein